MPVISKKAIEKQVSDACNRHAKGRQFDIFDLSKISRAGLDAAACGRDIDAAVLAAAIHYNKLPEVAPA